MVPVSPDLLGWVAHELSLCLLEERDGELRVLAGTARVDGVSLTDALAEVAGCEAELLTELVERARTGNPGTLELEGDEGRRGVVLVWSEGSAHTRALYSPRAESAVLVRRAAAADLAAAVTHEVANALTAIAGWTKMAATGPADRTAEALEVVERSARQALGAARGLLRTMRDTSRPSVFPSMPERTDAALVVREVIETLRPELEQNGVALRASVPATVWGASSPAPLRLIVSNLVRNAFEALDGDKGTITISMDVRGDRYVLTVGDDGPGMSSATVQQAFDRYFTTKDTGTGLGLALVRDTVDDAGGRLEVWSQVDVGTRFDVWLPVAGAALLSKHPPRVASDSGVHPKPVLVQKSVLVVDDDEAMRSMVRTALELQGATVVVAADREEALADPRRFDVVLIDLALGDARGDEVLAELRAADRVDRAILMTGSSSHDLSADGAPDATLRKPFQLDALHRVIEEVCAQRSLEAEG